MSCSKEAFGGRSRGGAEFWHSVVTNIGSHPNDKFQMKAAQQRLLAKGSALSGRIEEERELHTAMDIVRLRSLLDANPRYTKGLSEPPGELHKKHEGHINAASGHIIDVLKKLNQITNDEGLEQKHMLRTLSDLDYAYYALERLLLIVDFITCDDVKYAQADKAPGFLHLHE